MSRWPSLRPLRPFSLGYGGETLRPGHEAVPRGAADVDDVVVAVEDPVREGVLAETLPEAFDRVEVGAVWRQRHQGEGVRDDRAFGDVPAGPVETRSSIAASPIVAPSVRARWATVQARRTTAWAPGATVPADFVEMGGHRFGGRMRHDERRAGGALRADGTGKVGPGVATVFRCPRAGAFAGPEAREGSLLTDPCVRRENGPLGRFLTRLTPGTKSPAAFLSPSGAGPRAPDR